MKKNWKKLLLIIFILLASVLWFRKDSFLANPNHAISAVSTTNIENIDLIKIPTFYNQRDEQWVKIKLGKTDETLGKIGCLVSSVGMNLSFYGIDMNPKEINEKLTEYRWFYKAWLVNLV